MAAPEGTPRLSVNGVPIPKGAQVFGARSDAEVEVYRRAAIKAGMIEDKTFAIRMLQPMVVISATFEAKCVPDKVTVKLFGKMRRVLDIGSVNLAPPQRAKLQGMREQAFQNKADIFVAKVCDLERLPTYYEETGFWLNGIRAARRGYGGAWSDARTEYVEDALRAAGYENLIPGLWEPLAYRFCENTANFVAEVCNLKRLPMRHEATGGWLMKARVATRQGRETAWSDARTEYVKDALRAAGYEHLIPGLWEPLERQFLDNADNFVAEVCNLERLPMRREATGGWLMHARAAKRHGRETVWSDDRTDYVEEALRTAGYEHLIPGLWEPFEHKFIKNTVAFVALAVDMDDMPSCKAPGVGAWITKAREAKRFYDEHGHSHGKNTWDDDRTEYVEEALRAAGMERIICKLWNPRGGKRGRPPGKKRSKKNKKGSTGS